MTTSVHLIWINILLQKSLFQYIMLLKYCPKKRGQTWCYRHPPPPPPNRCHTLDKKRHHWSTCYWPPCCAVAQLPPTWLTRHQWSKATHGPSKKQVEDPPGPRACGRIWMLEPEWHWVELLTACEPFHACTLAVAAPGCNVFAHTLPDKTCWHHTSIR